MLLALENRPPVSNSASKAKARRCRVHFFPAFFVCSSDTTASALLLLLAQKKKDIIPAQTATTIRMATVACRAGEHEMLLQDFADTITTLGTLLAAMVGVPRMTPLN